MPDEKDVMKAYKIFFDFYLITPSNKYLPSSCTIEIICKVGVNGIDIAKEILQRRLEDEGRGDYKFEIVSYAVMNTACYGQKGDLK